MGKKGQLGKIKKHKQIKAIRKQMHTDTGRTIKPEDFENFVLVRYGLTLKKRLTGVDKQTVQRFLQELLRDNPPAGVWDLDSVLTQTLKEVNVHVPFKFYERLVANWPEIEHFLRREIPAVPLAQRIQIYPGSHIQEVVLRQLDANMLIFISKDNPNIFKEMTMEKMDALNDSLTSGGLIDWEKVADIFAPFGFDINTASDDGTRQWFDQLLNE